MIDQLISLESKEVIFINSKSHIHDIYKSVHKYNFKNKHVQGILKGDLMFKCNYVINIC